MLRNSKNNCLSVDFRCRHTDRTNLEHRHAGSGETSGCEGSLVKENNTMVGMRGVTGQISVKEQKHMLEKSLVWMKTISATNSQDKNNQGQDNIRYNSFHTNSAVSVHTCSSAAIIKQLNEILTDAGQEPAGDRD